MELAGRCAHARDAHVHRVGDHALRLVLRRLLLRASRQPERFPPEWPPEPYHFPVFVAGVNTAILVTSSFTMHWALQSIKRGERAGFLAGMVLTFVMGLAFLLTQVVEYLNVGFNTGDGAFASVFFGLTGLRRPRRGRAQPPPSGHHPRFRGHFTPSITTVSSYRGSTGTSST